MIWQNLPMACAKRDCQNDRRDPSVKLRLSRNALKAAHFSDERPAPGRNDRVAPRAGLCVLELAAAQQTNGRTREHGRPAGRQHSARHRRRRVPRVRRPAGHVAQDHAGRRGRPAAALDQPHPLSGAGRASRTRGGAQSQARRQRHRAPVPAQRRRQLAVQGQGRRRAGALRRSRLAHRLRPRRGELLLVFKTLRERASSRSTCASRCRSPRSTARCRRGFSRTRPTSPKSGRASPRRWPRKPP